jgi:hypothetical protein
VQADQAEGRTKYRLVGLATMVLGLFVVLISADVISVADSTFSAPRWVAGCAGLSFLLGGAAVAMARPGGPPGTLAANPYLGGTAALVLVLILNWIAFGTGPRHFSGGIAIPFVSWAGRLSEWSGRAAFGVCAVIADLVAVWLLARGVINLFHRRER